MDISNLTFFLSIVFHESDIALGNKMDIIYFFGINIEQMYDDFRFVLLLLLLSILQLQCLFTQFHT